MRAIDDDVRNSNGEQDGEIIITGSMEGVEKVEDDDDTATESTGLTCTTRNVSMNMIDDVEVKKEEAGKQVRHSTRNIKFTQAEDNYLKAGIVKHGKGSWAQILGDPEYKFHASRSRDSLRIRAKGVTFKLMKHVS